MSYSKTIVCLANSRKPGGRCVAGKEALRDGYGGWIRPVSARPSAEISFEERQYESGKDLKILDVIEIPMIAPVPRVHQTENHMIDATFYWTKKKSLQWDDLEVLVEKPSQLWGTGESTYHGTNDRISQASAAKFDWSLCLIKPKDVSIRVLTPGADFGNHKRAARARFTHRGVIYDFKVTDPIAEQAFLARENGEYELDQDLFFCLSLAEAHTDGYCYKLIATVISKEDL